MLAKTADSARNVRRAGPLAGRVLKAVDDRGDRVVNEQPLGDRRRRPGEDHQVADHVADAKCLRGDRRQALPPTGIGLVLEQRLPRPTIVASGLLISCPAPAANSASAASLASSSSREVASPGPSRREWD